MWHRADRDQLQLRTTGHLLTKAATFLNLGVNSIGKVIGKLTHHTAENVLKQPLLFCL